ncbi:unnamed protein product [Didymodactylos carnosus]|uniref:Uncharacterized protein n=1 Tax=Didymodactylos carnosus TaxID=1234261 RepID=A0A8S2FQ07_9BILA|nr:unnamed protein product [Didymodactylos carnosus]CAF4318046.1 unnamed protein product [Didymodactylos carnosus]
MSLTGAQGRSIGLSSGNCSVSPWLSLSDCEFDLSYLWPLFHSRSNVFVSEHTKDNVVRNFHLKYDLPLLNFLHTQVEHHDTAQQTTYPSVLILYPTWSACKTAYDHSEKCYSEQYFEKISVCLIYEGQWSNEQDLYRQLITNGCDVLISTATIVNNLIQYHHIHFEQIKNYAFMINVN